MARFSPQATSSWLVLLTAVALGAVSGCSTLSSTLIGNVNPVEVKSETYGVADLALNSAEWTRIPADSQSLQGTGEITPTEISDVAFLSKKTRAVISLSSACRAGGEMEKSLQAATNLLFLGITDVGHFKERELLLANHPALETTVRGKIQGQEVMMRAVVLRRDKCLYDLLYVTRPDRFEQNLEDFSHFVASLRIK